MSDVATIRAKIKGVLDGISELAFVADNHQANIDGYPAVTFDESENTNVFLTNKDNLRQFSFLLVIYNETKIQGLDVATDRLDIIEKKVIEAFEADLTLTGSVNWCNPVGGPRLTLDTPQGLVVTKQLSLQCNAVVQT